MSATAVPPHNEETLIDVLSGAFSGIPLANSWPGKEGRTPPPKPSVVAARPDGQYWSLRVAAESEIRTTQKGADVTGHLWQPNLETVASLTPLQSEVLDGLTIPAYDKRNKKFFDLWYGHESPWINAPQLDVVLDYPFRELGILTIYPVVYTCGSFTRTCIQVEYVLWCIAQAYVEIYENRAEAFGIWGHELSDLTIEGLILCPEYNRVDVIMGS